MLIINLQAMSSDEITGLYNYFDIQAINLNVNMMILFLFILSIKYFYNSPITDNLWVDIIIMYLAAMVFLLIIYSIKYIFNILIIKIYFISI